MLLPSKNPIKCHEGFLFLQYSLPGMLPSKRFENPPPPLIAWMLSTEKVYREMRSDFFLKPCALRDVESASCDKHGTVANCVVVGRMFWMAQCKSGSFFSCVKKTNSDGTQNIFIHTSYTYIYPRPDTILFF